MHRQIAYLLTIKNFKIMKIHKRIILGLSLLVFSSGFAQSVTDPITTNKKFAVGLRAGGPSGITFKKYKGINRAFEGIIGFMPHGMSFTGLMETLAPSGVARLDWYYGAGGHVALFGRDPYYRNHVNYYHHFDEGFALGIDGVLGLEYKIKPIPIALSFDIKPSVEFHSVGHVHTYLDPGLGVKVVF